MPHRSCKDEEQLARQFREQQWRLLWHNTGHSSRLSHAATQPGTHYPSTVLM